MIDVRGLYYRYPKQQEDTLRGISFSVAKGEIFGFLGPSGSGKSTTQKLLTGLLGHYRGSLTVMGRDAHAWKQDLYRHIGVGFELPNHFGKLTGLENLQLFASFYGGQDSKAMRNPGDLLALVGLEDAARKRVAEYSKGMKMRLSFARALLNDPSILFLDEPTAGLDPVNARLIKDIIREQKNKGKTVFLTTHNMNDADQLCDRIAFIVEGKLTLVDEPAALKLQFGNKSVKVACRASDRQSLPESHEFPLEGLGSNSEFLELLNLGEVESIHSQEATLEDVFVKTTGKQLT